MTEKEFLAAILKEAKPLGWLAFHQLPAIRSNGRGWHSATQGDVGFPDLVLVHRKRARVIFAELKVKPNKPTDDQLKWLDALDACAEEGVGVEAYVWYPEHIPQIVALLYGRALAR